MQDFSFFRTNIPSLLVTGIFCIGLIIGVSACITSEMGMMTSPAPGSSSRFTPLSFSGVIDLPYRWSQISCRVTARSGDALFFREHLWEVLWPIARDAWDLSWCELVLEELRTYKYTDQDWQMLSGSLTLTLSGQEKTWSQDIALDAKGYPRHSYREVVGSGVLWRDPALPPNISARIAESLPIYQKEGRIMSVSSGVLALHPRVFPTPWKSDVQEVIYLRSSWSSEWIVDAYGFPSHSPLSRVGSYPHGSATGGQIALTFDDGPHPVYTPRVLDILARSHQKATFCVLWSQAQKYPDLIVRIVSEGHELCNHSFRHSDFATLSLSGVYEEILHTDQILTDILSWAHMRARTPFLVRPPYGSLTRDIEYSIPRVFLLWDSDSLDWKIKKWASILKRLDTPKSGNIVLFHDIHPQWVEILERYIESYESSGLSSVWASDLVGDRAWFDWLGQSVLSAKDVRFLKSPIYPRLRVFWE